MAAVMASGQHRIMMFLVVALSLDLALGAALGPGGDRYGPKFEYDGGDDGHHYVTFNYGNDGVYKFSFKLPEQTRYEERNEEGEVRGSYSFIDPEGEEFSLQYLADKEGFQPVADHLPVAPEETEDVKEARKAFAEFYDETVKYLKALSSKESSEESSRYQTSSRDQDVSGSYQPGSLAGAYGYNGGYQPPRLGDIDGDDDDDEEEDSSSESEEDDDDEDSSEEDDDDDSSEEDDEESDEDDDEDSDEDEEEEERKSGNRGDRNGRRYGRNEEEDEEENEDEEDEEKKEGRESSYRRQEERKSKNDRKESRSGKGSYKRREY